MIKRILVSTVFMTLCFFSSGQTKTFNEKNIQVKWELVTNNYQDKEQTLAAFTLVNNSKSIFPSAGWAIYFNSSREISTPQTVNGVTINHFNGDIYKITPGSIFKVIKPNEQVTIEYISEGVLINYTAAPCGLYIVWDNNPGKGISIADFSISPLKNTTSGLVTPEIIFRKNSIINNIAAEKLVKIFPSPVSYTEMPGAFLLNAEVKINTDIFFQKEASHLSNELGLLLKKKPEVIYHPTAGKEIQFKKEPMPHEAYMLTVNDSNIEIKASSGAGIFYGIQSLKTLMPASTWATVQTSINIPSVKVEDNPRFGYRSLLLDVARNFQTKKEIFKILDLMALYKLNVFHFHLDDDEGWRLEIPSLPELTEIGSNRGHTTDSKKLLPASYAAGPEPGKTNASGYYTKTDFIEIVKYAAERHIQVIPEIESPGHSRAAIKAMDVRYDKFMQQGNKVAAALYLLRDSNDKSVYSSAQQWTDNVMCVALPSVYNFLEKVTDEIILMYKEANAPLSTIHFGGDEVPEGVWEKSPACQQLISNDSAVRQTDDLWYYYFMRVNKMLRAKNLFLSGWEEVGMRKTFLDGEKKMIVNPQFANDNIQLHVWNNVVGWGAEDLPYRLANAGYKVVLSPVSNNYFDLAYYKSPDEPGYYWGGFQDIDKPFYFIPFDYYKNTTENAASEPVNASNFIGRDRLTDFGKSNIVGVQGLLWSENVRTETMLDYLLLPKLLGLAERAWAKDPDWAIEKDKTKSEQLYNEAWSKFVNVVGKRELPRLDNFAGGFKYRIPAVGAVIDNGAVVINIQLPGLAIRYTTDNSEPTLQSNAYDGPIKEKGKIKIRVFDSKGRGSRITEIDNK